MRKTSLFFCVAVNLLGARLMLAQPPFPPPGSRGDSSLDAFIGRMMAYDEDRDGKLSRSEISDERLLDLFDRADANHDGTVTKAELKALYTRESAFNPGDRPPREHRGGPDGGGPGMRQEGQVLQERTQRMLNLTAQQRATLADIQRDVDTRLDKLLTPAQKLQLKELQERGPFGPRPRPSGSQDYR